MCVFVRDLAFVLYVTDKRSLYRVRVCAPESIGAQPIPGWPSIRHFGRPNRSWCDRREDASQPPITERRWAAAAPRDCDAMPLKTRQVYGR
jgi:hypothetical protein